MTFSPPQGITFRTEDEIAVNDLCAVLRRIARFLQGLQLSSSPLRLYHDWWEHDGLHFDRGVITFHDLFAMVEMPRAIFEATPDEDEVFVGVAPEDAHWYLRFRAGWSGDNRSIGGKFAITIPSELAADFRAEIAAERRLVEESAESYYKRVRV
jgi:hypothetical protein